MISNGHIRSLAMSSEETEQKIARVADAIISKDVKSLTKEFLQGRITGLDKDGNTCLHVAARCGSMVCLKFLLKSIPEALHVKNKQGLTCAHLAAKFKHVKCLRIIINCNQSPPMTIACERDAQGMTVLHYCALSGLQESVAWLNSNFGRTLSFMQNQYGQTALHFAAAKGHLGCVQILARNGKKIINAKDKEGATATFYAAQQGHANCLRYLVHSCSADLGITTKDNQTALMAATKTGNVDMTRTLLDKRNNLELTTAEGATVFHMAAACEDPSVLTLLLSQAGADRAVMISTNAGQSPAHIAAQQGNVECLKILAKSGLNMFIADSEEFTPYLLALHSSNPDCVQFAKSLTGGDVLDPNTVARKYATLRKDINRVSKIVDIRLLTDEEAKNFKGTGKKTKDKKSYLGKGRKSRADDRYTTKNQLQTELSGQTLTPRDTDKRLIWKPMVLPFVNDELSRSKSYSSLGAIGEGEETDVYESSIDDSSFSSGIRGRQSRYKSRSDEEPDIDYDDDDDVVYQKSSFSAPARQKSNRRRGRDTVYRRDLIREERFRRSRSSEPRYMYMDEEYDQSLRRRRQFHSQDHLDIIQSPGQPQSVYEDFEYYPNRSVRFMTGSFRQSYYREPDPYMYGRFPGIHRPIGPAIYYVDQYGFRTQRGGYNEMDVISRESTISNQSSAANTVPIPPPPPKKKKVPTATLR